MKKLLLIALAIITLTSTLAAEVAEPKESKITDAEVMVTILENDADAMYYCGMVHLAAELIITQKLDGLTIDDWLLIPKGAEPLVANYVVAMVETLNKVPTDTIFADGEARQDTITDYADQNFMSCVLTGAPDMSIVGISQPAPEDSTV